jgi:hypothetical protein
LRASFADARGGNKEQKVRRLMTLRALVEQQPEQQHRPVRHEGQQL